MVNYFFQTPFIFSHRVILHLQREHKDSYHCALSYVAIITFAFSFLPITFILFVASLTFCMNSTSMYLNYGTCTSMAGRNSEATPSFDIPSTTALNLPLCNRCDSLDLSNAWHNLPKWHRHD